MFRGTGRKMNQRLCSICGHDIVTVGCYIWLSSAGRQEALPAWYATWIRTVASICVLSAQTL